MRHHRPVLGALLGLALALPAVRVGASLSPGDAWTIQGQGQGKGRGQGQGNGRGARDDRGRGQQRVEVRRRGQAAEARQEQRQEAREDRRELRQEIREDRREDRAEVREERREQHAEMRVERARRRAAERVEVRRRMDGLPVEWRRLATSRRRDERLVLNTIALASLRGLGFDRVRVRSEPERVRLLTHDDRVLLVLDEPRARDLGYWSVHPVTVRDDVAGAPSFCRSGEGHPVWGREWCLQKGFGLGSSPGRLWTRGLVDDVVFRRPTTRLDDDLDWEDLLGVLGEVALDRLALHSVSLGYAEPLTGFWVTEPRAPQILRVRSGNDVVAELVDVDRDDRVEVMYVLALD